MEDTTPGPSENAVERLVLESLIDLRQAVRLYGETTHKATVTRHITKGVRLPNGTILRLEAITVGGRLMTSKAAVLRFFARQNEAPDGVPAPHRSPHARVRAAKLAADELDAMGIK